MKNILSLIVVLLLSYRCLNAQSADTCSIDLEPGNASLNVFPNPTDGTFKIIYGSTTECPPVGWGGELLINIINEDGKTVYSETVPEFDGEYNRIIDLSTHEKGVYIIELVAGKLKKVKREVLK